MVLAVQSVTFGNVLKFDQVFYGAVHFAKRTDFVLGGVAQVDMRSRAGAGAIGEADNDFIPLPVVLDADVIAAAPTGAVQGLDVVRDVRALAEIQRCGRCGRGGLRGGGFEGHFAPRIRG